MTTRRRRAAACAVVASVVASGCGDEAIPAGRSAVEVDAAPDRAGGGDANDVTDEPEPAPSDGRSDEFFAFTAEEAVGDDARVEIEVDVVGAEPGVGYGLRGSRLLGWFATADDGQNVLDGWLPVGEHLRLVTQPTPGGSVTVVADVPPLVVGRHPDGFRAFIDLADQRPRWRTGLSRPELDTLLRADLGLPPETGD